MNTLDGLMGALEQPAQPPYVDDDVAIAIASLRDYMDRQALATCEIAKAINHLADTLAGFAIHV